MNSKVDQRRELGSRLSIQKGSEQEMNIASRNNVRTSRVGSGLAILAAFGLFAASCGSDGTTTSADDTSAEAAETSSDAITTSTDATTASSDAAVSYVLPATGQTTCYGLEDAIDCPTAGEDYYGQDANYVAGAEMSFEDNGDGTVTDLVTGLTWQQDPPSEDFPWDDAVAYANEVELGGYDDWRLPSLKELFSISDFSSGWPYLDTEYFSLVGDEVSKDQQYWSSNYYVGVTDDGGENTAFGVNHVTGHIKGYRANGTGPIGGKYVRVVRGDEYGINDFVDNGDETITDEATGLMWAQSDDGEGLDWVDALAYAEASELAGYDDWRLPNVKELQSIVDYTQSPTATDSSAVGPAVDDLFLVTETETVDGELDYGYYWSSTSAHFRSGEPYYYAWYVAAGRAIGPEGVDHHGAGAVRFDTKTEDGPDGESEARVYNFVRLVREAG